MQDRFTHLLKAGSLTQEMQSLFKRLQAYQEIERLYGFCPSEISSFILRPIGRDSQTCEIVYNTLVSLKSGAKATIDTDIRNLLPS